MAAASGRRVAIKKGGITIAKGVSKSISITNEAVDITNDDDGGWRKLLDTDAANRSVDLSFEGWVDAATFRALSLGTASSLMLTDITVVWESGGTLSGNFWFGSYSEQADTKDAIKASMALQSSGTMTYTP